MYPVVLEGSRTRLREFQPDDLDPMTAYASDPEVMGWINTGQTFDREFERKFLADLLRIAQESHRSEYSLAMVISESGEMIGAGRITIEDREHRRGDIGYVVRRNRWGHGYATEAASLLVRFGFDELDLHRISAVTHPDNRASARVLEKIGMKLEGRIRDHMRTQHGWRDSLLYAIVKHDD
jgi:ribosomal-protein-alanine N-acetyltransferase